MRWFTSLTSEHPLAAAVLLQDMENECSGTQGQDGNQQAEQQHLTNGVQASQFMIDA
jgi:hypothetical protein